MMQKHTYSYTPQYLLRDGRPWLPTMGEIHYARCQPDTWRESVRLMKAGGVDIIATYIFWIHHEPTEGQFDFTGCRDLGRFLDICEEEGMPVWLRIGPWCHGECRYGGFPEWLQHGGYGLRSDDPAYMACVRRFWEALYEQVKRHIGGCVIGLQFENEFHGSDGHMVALEKLADEIGFTAPLHTATGWGSAAVGTSLPVFGGYPDEPWHWRVDKLPPNSNYLLCPTRDDNNIGANESEEDNIKYPPRFDQDLYPYLTAEIGGGCQPTYNRRPISAASDVGAIVTAKIASGTVMPGIYVYHGGTNPGYGLHETKASGYGTDVPELNYDFQAPIGEYGKINDAYREFRRLFTFLRDFGEGLAVMAPVFPADNPRNPTDLEHLRYCYRTDGEGGYLFVNNYVRGYRMAEHTRALTVTAGAGEVVFPEMTFADGDYGFFPFNLPLGRGKLVSTNAQPLCRLNGENGGQTYVFFTDREPIYNTEGDLTDVEILTLSVADSYRASKVTVGGREYLILCDAAYTQDGDALVFSITEDTPLRVYPDPRGGEGFGEFLLICPDHPVSVRTELISENVLMKEFSLIVDPAPDGASDLLLDVEYEGNIIELFADGRKAADQFSLGNGWHLGLRRFGGRREFTLRLFSLTEGAPVYMERKPRYRNGFACELLSVTARAEFRVRFEKPFKQKNF